MFEIGSSEIVIFGTQHHRTVGSFIVIGGGLKQPQLNGQIKGFHVKVDCLM